MIIVRSIVNERVSETQFAETKKGDRESIKHIESIYQERLNHPFFYKSDLISRLELRIKGFAKNSKSKTKIRMESQLVQAINDRREILELFECDDVPPPVI